VSVVDALGRAIPLRGLASWLGRVVPRSVRGQVTIALVSDQRIRTLNRRYRRKDAVTDVLSFPAEDNNPSVGMTQRSRGRTPAPPDTFLGDIVIARGRASAQAREARHSVQVELRVLALHGLLHLLGYDHERDHGEMRRLEAGLLRKSGLKSGLIERNR
jgi:probable rRNA maturation factor